MYARTTPQHVVGRPASPPSPLLRTDEVGYVAPRVKLSTCRTYLVVVRKVPENVSKYGSLSHHYGSLERSRHRTCMACLDSRTFHHVAVWWRTLPAWWLYDEQTIYVLLSSEMLGTFLIPITYAVYFGCLVNYCTVLCVIALRIGSTLLGRMFCHHVCSVFPDKRIGMTLAMVVYPSWLQFVCVHLFLPTADAVDYHRAQVYTCVQQLVAAFAWYTAGICFVTLVYYILRWCTFGHDFDEASIRTRIIRHRQAQQSTENMRCDSAIAAIPLWSYPNADRCRTDNAAGDTTDHDGKPAQQTQAHSCVTAHNLHCPICLCKFVEKEMVTHCEICQNNVHAVCLGTWYLRQRDCPLCRHPVRFCGTNAQPERHLPNEDNQPQTDS